MKPTLTFARNTKNVKKPTYLKNGVFLIYAPRKIKFLLRSLRETTQKSQLLYQEIIADISLQNSDQTRSKQLLAINNEFG